MPFFSVIVPVFNAEASLEACLDSIASQNFKDIEVIVVNDGSSDRSLSIASEWQEAHKDISTTILDQPNKGLAVSRNRAIERSNGQFVALLDADDMWTRDKLSRVFTFIQKSSKINVIYHQAFRLLPGKNGSYGKRSGVRKSRAVTTLRDLLLNGSPIVPSTVVMQRELARQYPFPEEPEYGIAEDIYLWIQLLHHGAQFHYLKKPLAYYREAGGISSDISNHLKSVFAVYHHFYQAGYFDIKTLSEARKRKYYEAARFYHKSGNFQKAEEYYLLTDNLYPLKTSALRTLCSLKLSL